MDDAVDPATCASTASGQRPHLLAKLWRMSGPDGQPLALLDNVMPATPSGKIELASEVLATRWGDTARLPGYRLPSEQIPAVVDLTLLDQPAFRRPSWSRWQVRRGPAASCAPG